MADNVIRTSTPDAAQYGRNPEGARAARDEWWGMQAQNDQRQQMTGDAMRYAASGGGGAQQAQENGQLSNNFASGAGGNQQGSIQLARQLAMGQSPSEAAYQLQAGLDESTRYQQAMAGSARGSAALATAGSNAQANTANLQQNAFTQGGMLRARDMAAGAGMYGTLLGQQREQAAARLGMANEMSQFNASQNDRYSLGMSQAAQGLGGAANGQNQIDLGYYQQGMNPINAQTEAWQQYQAWLENSRRQARAIITAENG